MPPTETTSQQCIKPRSYRANPHVEQAQVVKCLHGKQDIDVAVGKPGLAQSLQLTPMSTHVLYI